MVYVLAGVEFSYSPLEIVGFMVDFRELKMAKYKKDKLGRCSYKRKPKYKTVTVKGSMFETITADGTNIVLIKLPYKKRILIS